MAATDVHVEERKAIATAVQLYIDGASKGDAEKLGQAFHEQAAMFGSLGGQRYDLTIPQLTELVTSRPLDSDGSFRARITSIEHEGDIARVRLEEDGCWGAVSFVDYFTLAKVDGAWKIVNKTFTHTGGELPQA